MPVMWAKEDTLDKTWIIHVEVDCYNWLGGTDWDVVQVDASSLEEAREKAIEAQRKYMIEADGIDPEDIAGITAGAYWGPFIMLPDGEITEGLQFLIDILDNDVVYNEIFNDDYTDWFESDREAVHKFLNQMSRYYKKKEEK